MPKPNKPLFVIDARLINTSGIGTVCQNTIPYILKHYNIILLGNESELKAFDWSSECKIVPFKAEIYSLSEQLKLKNNVPQCDYFLSPHYNVPLLPIKAKKRIVIIHDVNHIALRNTLSFIKRIYAQFVIHFALKLSDKIITVSEFSRKEIRKYFPANSQSIYKIPLGVDKKQFHLFSEPEKHKITKKYALPENYILYVGNVKPHKNLQVLIKAFALLKKDKNFKNYKLVIVGKKEGFITGDNSISILIDTLNIYLDVLFTGFVEQPDLPILYAQANLFVFPSLYEGFGLPPLEAMACGCPVIVSDAASLPEIYKDAALFFNPNDALELNNTMIKLLNNVDLRQQMIEKGLKLAAEQNWNKTAETLLNIINS